MDPGTAGFDELLTVPSSFRIAPGCAGFDGSMTKMPGPERETVNMPLATDCPPESMLTTIVPVGVEPGTTKLTCDLEANNGVAVAGPSETVSGIRENTPNAAA